MNEMLRLDDGMDDDEFDGSGEIIAPPTRVCDSNGGVNISNPGAIATTILEGSRSSATSGQIQYLSALRNLFLRRFGPFPLYQLHERYPCIWPVPEFVCESSAQATQLQ